MTKKIYEFHDVTDEVYYPTFSTTKRYVAQTFTVGNTGTNEDFVIQEAQLKLLKTGSPTAALSVEVWTVNTSSLKPEELLASGSVTAASVSGSSTFVSCTNFTGLLTLNASGKYALVIYHSDATSANYYRWQGDDASPSSTYSGGNAYQSNDNGKTWALVTASDDLADANFYVLGGKWKTAVCTYEDVINKAGSGANATAKDIATVSNFVLQAEGILNARTRRNWTSAYATLDDDVKGIISEIVSNLAAIKVINYSMAGYASRLEAQAIIDNLYNQSERLINELKEQDVQTFMINA